jgi:hypothetical protein
MRSTKFSRETLAELSATVTRLLQHYWTADDPVTVRTAQIADWLEDLREFGPAVVARACVEWRRVGSRRPLPSDIRRLCIEDISASRAPEAQADMHRAERQEARRQAGEDMRREGRDLINQWARARGHADVDAMAEARGVHWSAIYREHIGEVVAAAPIARVSPRIADVARGLGVTATEFSPTPEQLADARRDLGLETTRRNHHQQEEMVTNE